MRSSGASGERRILHDENSRGFGLQASGALEILKPEAWGLKSSCGSGTGVPAC